MISNAFIPVFVVLVIVYALFKKTNVYNSFVSGAMEGVYVAFRVFPYIVAIVVAVRCFYNSGAFDFLKNIFKFFGVQPELAGVMFFKPFSHSASIGYLTEIIRTHGADSLITRMAATIIGSAETTFYVVALYCGSVGLKKLRYLIPVCLISDIAGAIIAILVVKFFSLVLFY